MTQSPGETRQAEQAKWTTAKPLSIGIVLLLAIIALLAVASPAAAQRLPVPFVFRQMEGLWQGGSTAPTPPGYGYIPSQLVSTDINVTFEGGIYLRGYAAVGGRVGRCNVPAGANVLWARVDDVPSRTAPAWTFYDALARWVKWNDEGCQGYGLGYSEVVVDNRTAISGHFGFLRVRNSSPPWGADITREEQETVDRLNFCEAHRANLHRIRMRKRRIRQRLGRARQRSARRELREQLERLQRKAERHRRSIPKSCGR